MLTIAQLEQELANAKAAAAESDKQARQAQSEAWTAITKNPDSYEWMVGPTKPYMQLDKAGLRISRRIKPEILEEWKKGGFATFSTDDQNGRWLGMVYYRTSENILTHCGGGHLVLNDPMLCNDEEWAELTKGNILAKYKR